MTQSTSTKAALWSLLQRWGIPILIVILGLVSLFALAYQANAPIRESRHQITRQIKYSDALIIQISHPLRLPLEKLSTPGYPISVWLNASQPPAGALTYSVGLEPAIGEISFTDKDGMPYVAPRVDLDPDKPVGALMTWYVQRVPRNWQSGTTPKTVTKLGLHLWDTSGQELGSWRVPIELETAFGAWWRQFMDLALGPSTPQIGLIGILLALAWGWYEKGRDARLERKHHDEEERKGRRRQRQLDDISSLDTYWQTDPGGAVDQYIQLRTRVPQEDDDLTGRLDRMWRDVWRARVLDQAIEAFRNTDDQRARKLAEQVGTAGARKTQKVEGDKADESGDEQTDHAEADHLLTLLPPLQRSNAQLDAIVALAASRGTVLAARLQSCLLDFLSDDDMPDMLTRLRYFVEKTTPDRLQPRWLLSKAEVQVRLEELVELVKSTDEHTASTLMRYSSCGPYEWPTLSRGNAQEPVPFEGARARPPFWSDLAGPHTFVFSAKLVPYPASALRELGEYWQKEANGKHDKVPCIFPVSVDTQLLLVSSTRVAFYEALSYDVVRALLQFFALNPDAFEATPREQQRGIACLVSAHRQRLGDLATYFRTTGKSEHPRATDRLCRLLADAGHDTRSHVLTSESRLLSVLVDARVFGFESYGLLLDVTTDNVKRYSPDMLVSKLKLLCAGIPDLSGARVIVKASIPDEIIDPLEVKWSLQQLTELLRNQVSEFTTVNLGGPGQSLAALFGPDRPSDPDSQIVAAAGGSPRQLVSFCEALFLRWKRRQDQDGNLAAADLADVISSSV